MGLNYLTKSPFVQTMLEVKYIIIVLKHCVSFLVILALSFIQMVLEDGLQITAEKRDKLMEEQHVTVLSWATLVYFL